MVAFVVASGMMWVVGQWKQWQWLRKRRKAPKMIEFRISDFGFRIFRLPLPQVGPREGGGKSQISNPKSEMGCGGES